MSFKPEDKVIWNQLSTSLQERFKDLERRAQKNIDMSNENAKNIAINTANIQKNANRIASLRQKADQEINSLLTDISNIHVPDAGGPSTTLFMSGETGQIAKIDPINHRLFPHDNFQMKLICDASYMVNRFCSMPHLMMELGNKIGDCNIYDLSTNTIRTYNGSNWIMVNADINSLLTNRTFYLNPYSGNVYFYYFKSKYVSFTARGNGFSDYANGMDISEIGNVRTVGTNYGTPYIGLIGDSLLDLATNDWIEATYGIVCPRDSHWGVLLERDLRGFVFNKGIGGTVMHPLYGAGSSFNASSILNRFKSSILTLAALPKYLIFDGGGNDFNHSSYDPDTIQELLNGGILNDYKSIISICQSKGIIPIPFIAPCGVMPSKGFKEDVVNNYMTTNNQVREYCKQANILYLDLYQTALYNSTKRVNEQYFAPDLIHFNVAGNKVVADYITNFFRTHNLA